MDTHDSDTTPLASDAAKSSSQGQAADFHALKQLVGDRWQGWLASTAIAVVVVLAVVFYRGHKASREETANRMLGEARNAQALTAIRTQYPGTAAAKLALLQIAKTQYDAGDYVMAMSSYADFLSQHPKHPMAPMAELGKIHCTEAMGQTADALAAYKDFVTRFKDGFLTPLAVFGQARCLQQLRRYDEARATYEDFLAASPKTPWKGEIDDALKQIAREARQPLVSR
jgi:TolA-binding protein